MTEVQEFLSKIIPAPSEDDDDSSDIREFLESALPEEDEDEETSFAAFLAEKNAPVVPQRHEPATSPAKEFLKELISSLERRSEKVSAATKSSPKKVSEEIKLDGKKPKDGRTPLLRASESAIEWKYTDEKEWRTLLDLSALRPTVDHESFESRMDQFTENLMDNDELREALNTSSLLGGGGHGPTPEFKVEEDILYWKLSNTEEWIELIQAGGGTGTPLEEAKLSKRIDTVGDFVYIGEADPGTAEDVAFWRISRVFVDPVTDDISITWAGTTANFDKLWTEHLTLTYS